MSDRERRKKLAALSFSEKVRILEKLRARSQAIAKAGLRKESMLKDSGRNHASKKDEP